MDVDESDQLPDELAAEEVDGPELLQRLAVSANASKEYRYDGPVIHLNVTLEGNTITAAYTTVVGALHQFCLWLGPDSKEVASADKQSVSVNISATHLFRPFFVTLATTARQNQYFHVYSAQITPSPTADGKLGFALIRESRFCCKCPRRSA